MSPTDPAPILGLDLGTCTCQASVVSNDKVVFIQPDLANYDEVPGRLDYPGAMMPSAFYHQNGRILVGKRAAAKLTDDRAAGDVVVEVKRHMGLEGRYNFTSGGRKFSPAEITGEYVKVLVNAAEKQLGLGLGAITEAVVTVPAYFGSAELAATRRACLNFGGLQKVHLIDEPVAAAYSLGLHRLDGVQRVLVVDLGGGTFDVTLLRVGRGVPGTGFEELGRDGDSRLGGLDWDTALARLALAATRAGAPPEELNRLLRGPGIGHNLLFEACETQKLAFFEGLDPASPGRLHVHYHTKLGGRVYDAEIEGRRYLDGTAHLVDRCIEVCEGLFADAAATNAAEKLATRGGFGWGDVDRVYMAGGGSNMATVRGRFRRAWGREPALDPAPQYAVAKGAALCADALRRGERIDFLGRPRYKRTVGVFKYEPGRDEPRFEPLIRRNQEIPIRLEDARPKPFPIVRLDDAPRLVIEIVEEVDGARGSKHRPLTTEALEDLPPANPGRQDLAEIRTSCDSEGVLTFHVAFRQTERSVRIDDRPNGVPGRNGSGRG